MAHAGESDPTCMVSALVELTLAAVWAPACDGCTPPLLLHIDFAGVPAPSSPLACIAGRRRGNESSAARLAMGRRGGVYGVCMYTGGGKGGAERPTYSDADHSRPAARQTPTWTGEAYAERSTPSLAVDMYGVCTRQPGQPFHESPLAPLMSFRPSQPSLPRPIGQAREHPFSQRALTYQSPRRDSP